MAGAGETTKRWPGETDEAFPEAFVKIPQQPKEKKPGQLTDEQIKQFFDEVGTYSHTNCFS